MRDETATVGPLWSRIVVGVLAAVKEAGARGRASERKEGSLRHGRSCNTTPCCVLPLPVSLYQYRPCVFPRLLSLPSPPASSRSPGDGVCVGEPLLAIAAYDASARFQQRVGVDAPGGREFWVISDPRVEYEVGARGAEGRMASERSRCREGGWDSQSDGGKSAKSCAACSHSVHHESCGFMPERARQGRTIPRFDLPRYCGRVATRSNDEDSGMAVGSRVDLE